MIDRARSAIILCLGHKALREVAREKTTASIWLKLESLYMTKSLANRLCLKQQLYTFKMIESRTATKQLADFNKILDDLENIEVKLEEENKALLLLNSLPKSFEHFKDAIIYGKDQDITLEEVQTSIRTKETQKQQDSKSEDNGESLNISRGRSEKREQEERSPDQAQGIQRMVRKQSSNALIVTKLVISRKIAQTRSRKDLWTLLTLLKPLKVMRVQVF